MLTSIHPRHYTWCFVHISTPNTVIEIAKPKMDRNRRWMDLRDLAGRRRWRGKNAKDRMTEKHFKRLSVYLMFTAIMLPPVIAQQLIRVNSILAYHRYLEIDRWQNLKADRVPVTELTIDNCSEETWYSQFRFHQRDLRLLFIALRFPERVVLSNKSVMPGEKAFLMMLYRMAYPRRLVDMEDFVGREYSTISRCFNFVVELMDVEHGHLLLDNLEFFLPRFLPTGLYWTK